MRFIPIIALIVCLLVISAMEYPDVVAQDDHYIDMVCAGAWPDYRMLEPDCGGK